MRRNNGDVFFADDFIWLILCKTGVLIDPHVLKALNLKTQGNFDNIIILKCYVNGFKYLHILLFVTEKCTSNIISTSNWYHSAIPQTRKHWKLDAEHDFACHTQSISICTYPKAKCIGLPCHFSLHRFYFCWISIALRFRTLYPWRKYTFCSATFFCASNHRIYTNGMYYNHFPWYRYYVTCESDMQF